MKSSPDVVEFRDCVYKSSVKSTNLTATADQLMCNSHAGANSPMSSAAAAA